MPDNRLIYLTIHADMALTLDELWPETPPDEITEQVVRGRLQEIGMHEVATWFAFSVADVDIYVPPEEPETTLRGVE